MLVIPVPVPSAFPATVPRSRVRTASNCSEPGPAIWMSPGRGTLLVLGVWAARVAARSGGVGGDDVAPAGDEAGIALPDILQVEGNVRDIAPREDAAELRREKRQARDVAGAGVKPQRRVVGGVQKARRVQGLLGLAHAVGAAGFIE